MSELTFAGHMLDALRSDASHHVYTAGQVRQVLSLFSFDSHRLRALVILAPRIVDPQSSYIIHDQFSFNSGRRRARQILAGQHAHHGRFYF